MFGVTAITQAETPQSWSRRIARFCFGRSAIGSRSARQMSEPAITQQPQILLRAWPLLSESGSEHVPAAGLLARASAYARSDPARQVVTAPSAQGQKRCRDCRISIKGAVLTEDVQKETFWTDVRLSSSSRLW
jgi:hypothetical protein